LTDFNAPPLRHDPAVGAFENGVSIMKQMKSIAARLLLAAGMMTAAAPAYAGCTVYEHINYGGAHWGLNGDDSLMMGACEESLGSTAGGNSYCRRDWNDQISSYRVSGNCKVRLWSDAGAYDPAGSKFSRGYGVSVSYVGDSWNDEASWAACYCS
jgi:syncollin